MTRAEDGVETNGDTSDGDEKPSNLESAAIVSEAVVEAASPAADDAPPLWDAAQWRTVFAGLPPRDLWRALQKDKPTQAQIFAGFRPAPEILRSNPIVANRLVDTAVKQPAFAKAVRELLPPSEEAGEDSPPAEAPPIASPEAPTAEEPAPAIQAPPAPLSSVSGAAKKAVAPNEDERSREKLNALRATARLHAARIKELETVLAQTEHERDMARKEAAGGQTALQTSLEATQRAEAEVRREKRIRERELAKVSAAAQAKAAKTAQRPAIVSPLPALVAAVPPPETLLYEAAQRLLQAGRYAVITDLCRQALLIGSPNANERGRVHSLYAQALYGLSDSASGATQDRLAAAAFLEGGTVVPAAEALARLAANSAHGFGSSDGPLLRRVGTLAAKTNQTVAVQAVFGRLRITAPSTYKTLRGAAGSGAAGEAALSALLGANATGSPNAVGPDEPVTLPHTPGFSLAAVTPRRLVRAVNSGDAQTVFAARAALHALRQQDKASAQLADALLEAIATLLPVAVCPLLHDKTRPVLVDASNVARYNADPLSLQTAPRVQYLQRMRDYLLRRGYFPVSLIADANLRYHVDDKAAYLELIEKQIVRETPPGTSADETLLQEARDQSVPLVTNDRFSDWGEAARQIERVGFLVSLSGVSLTGF